MGAAAGERVVVRGDPGGGLLAEPDVVPEGGEVLVAALGLVSVVIGLEARPARVDLRCLELAYR